MAVTSARLQLLSLASTALSNAPGSNALGAVKQDPHGCTMHAQAFNTTWPLSRDIYSDPCLPGTQTGCSGGPCSEEAPSNRRLLPSMHKSKLSKPIQHPIALFCRSVGFRCHAPVSLCFIWLANACNHCQGMAHGTDGPCIPIWNSQCLNVFCNSTEDLRLQNSNSHDVASL